MKKHISYWTAAGFALVALLLGAGVGTLISGDNIFEQLNKFKDVLAITQKFYVDTTDTQKLTEAAINGLLSQLDPHSLYLPPRETKQETERFQGSYQGVGLEIVSLNDTITVSEPMGGGPAIKLGILSNDRIVRINDSSAIGLTTAQASQRLRGPKETKVTVTIIRPGVKEPMVYEIMRDNIALNSIDVALMLSDNIGYVSVNRFSATTNDEMNTALTKLRDQGMKQLVLDLRGNPGGYLQQAEQMADLFLEAGTPEHPKTIVYTKARTKELEETFAAKSGDPFEKVPLIVLLSNGSASASEIVAGAIQDWDRGLIVGETSFGKGLVQHQWSFADGSSLRLTIAKYYTPSGRLIQRPYDGKDKQEYELEAFKRNEKEGENLQHAQDTKAGGDTLRPKYHTESGRVVYGGGGITPDYIIKPMELTEFTKNLLRRDVFYPFVTAYLDAWGRKIRSDYGSDYKRFAASYQIPDQMLSDFRSYIEKRGVKAEEESLTKDAHYITTRLKAYIARSIWSDEGSFSVIATVDTQLQKALMLFPEAQKIAGLDGEQRTKKVN